MSHVTTHVLDAAAGRPAAGVEVVLTAVTNADPLDMSGPSTPPTTLARGVTDADGRLSIGPENLAEGDYALWFGAGRYFAARKIDTFYPFVSIAFRVGSTQANQASHYHVPLLLSPFAYSTYRGS